MRKQKRREKIITIKKRTKLCHLNFNLPILLEMLKNNRLWNMFTQSTLRARPVAPKSNIFGDINMNSEIRKNKNLIKLIPAFK